MIAAIEPMNQIAVLRDDENSRRDAIDSHNVSLICDGQSCDDVNVSNGDLLDVVTVLGEDLHARTFITAIADDELAVGSHHCDLAWEPKLTFFLTGNAEVELEAAVLLEDLELS